MPLSSQAISFEDAELPSGFVAEGLVAPRQLIKSPDGPMVRPISGARFICLDDPDAVDARRTRLDPNAAKRLDGMRVVSPRSGVPTLAADGARLICRNVKLKRGQRFVFAWQFMTWGDMPWNDFACFEAIPDKDGHYGLTRTVLMDLAELANSGRRSTGWRLEPWEVLAPFSGTLIWTVANGQELNDPTLLEPAQEAFANPAALLLDDLRIF